MLHVVCFLIDDGGFLPPKRQSVGASWTRWNIIYEKNTSSTFPKHLHGVPTLRKVIPTWLTYPKKTSIYKWIDYMSIKLKKQIYNHVTQKTHIIYVLMFSVKYLKTEHVVRTTVVKFKLMVFVLPRGKRGHSNSPNAQWMNIDEQKLPKICTRKLPWSRGLKSWCVPETSQLTPSIVIETSQLASFIVILIQPSTRKEEYSFVGLQNVTNVLWYHEPKGPNAVVFFK